MRKSSILFVSLFAAVLFMAADIIPVVSLEITQAAQVLSKSQQQQFYVGESPQPPESKSSKTPIDSSPQSQGLSKIKLAQLAVFVPLSPGISLLRVVLQAQKKGAHYDNFVLFFFTTVAIFDFLVDKIPALATFGQFVQVMTIWGVIYLGCQDLAADPAELGLIIGLGILAIIVQFVRIGYTLLIDTTTIGVGAPARSLLEDLVALLMLPL